MVKEYKEIIGSFFRDNSFVESNIKSFNRFLDKGMQEIIDETREIVPTIIPQEFENFKIRFSKVNIEKPVITEADGSKRDVYPVEARLRSLTYASPIFLEVSAHINDVQRETFTANVGEIPIMLKSKNCHLCNLKKEELIEHGEDPHDTGGYFILNGNERVLITVEDLASNKIFIKKNSIGPSKFTAKIFSEKGSFRIPHDIEQMKDGILYLSFTRFKRVPVIAVIKALGLTKDSDIMHFICGDEMDDDVIINLYNYVNIKTKDEALDFLAKKIGMSAIIENKEERIAEQLDRYLLPHIGVTPKDRIYKAYNLCKLLKRFLIVSHKGEELDDKDHYMNKRLKLSGDLLEDLFRVNFRSLTQDVLYNFQRLVKRGKFQSIKIIIREQLLSSRIKSAMATGNWAGGRTGVSQNIQRTNALDTISHLQRVVSLLTSSQENFAARALHSTHWGRLCPVETPEGTPIGLRKNLALMCNISQAESNVDKVKKVLGDAGLKLVGQNG
ncbi:MAG: DNA-directed RNA polymerase subunit B'' [Nanoarchaeota archaeon]